MQIQTDIYFYAICKHSVDTTKVNCIQELFHTYYH